MKITSFRHENVLPDGTFDDRAGQVDTQGKILMSHENGGCGLDTCHCSDGHWLTIAKSRTEDGIVEGLTVEFDNDAEMQLFFKNRELFCK